VDRHLLGVHATKANQITRTGNLVTTERPPTKYGPCRKPLIFNPSHSTTKPGIPIAKEKRTTPSGRGIKRENTMKKSILIHTFVVLAIVATLPIGATAATPKKESGGSRRNREGSPQEKALLRP
jgi:hypothetical protein